MKQLFATASIGDLVEGHQQREVAKLLSRYSRGMIEVRREQRRRNRRSGR